jgi:hypothetical protein
MAKYGPASFGVLLVDGYNVLAQKVQDFTHKISAPMERSHGLGDATFAKAPVGLSQLAVTQAGAFFDDTTNRLHTLLSPAGATAVSRTLVAAFTGNTIGQLFLGASGVYGSAYDVLSQTEKLTKANVTYDVTGALDRGVVLHAHGARTADWTGTAVDNAASTANGGVGYLQVSDFATFTGAVIVIQHSTDNSVWADLVTFTNVTSAPNAQRITVAGTVNRYLRANGDVTGSGSITPFVGFARNP